MVITANEPGELVFVRVRFELEERGGRFGARGFSHNLIVAAFQSRALQGKEILFAIVLSHCALTCFERTSNLIVSNEPLSRYKREWKVTLVFEFRT